MARIVLICCEGTTEREYFDNLVKRVFRIPAYVDIRIEGEKGQHKALIDRVVGLRSELAQTEEVSEEEIECWAVCDDDRMRLTYAELRGYAQEKGVGLAFSRPQFESFLLQHFEPARETKPDKLYGKLGEYARCYGEDDYRKPDLRWLTSALNDKPKLVDTALANADQRTNESSSPFFTVQDLVRRLREMGRY